MSDPVDNVACAGGEAQNTPVANIVDGHLVTGETYATDGWSFFSFIHDVETTACGVINEITFKTQKSSAYKPNLRAADLRSRNQSRPNALARKYVFFTLQHHPKSRAFISRSGLGREYKRDHTTVIFAITNMAFCILQNKNHPWSEGYRRFAERLAERHGRFDYLEAAHKEAREGRRGA